MIHHSRRTFLRTSVAASAGLLLAGSKGSASERDMPLGLIVGVGNDPEGAVRKIHDLGLPTAQLGITDFSAAMVARVRNATKKYGITVTAINTSGPGPQIYDFYHGPETIGLVPRQYRQARIARLKAASDFAKKLGVPAVHTHCGFIPENPNNPVYAEAVQAIREVVSHCKSNGQIFLFEMGQETPITLLRAIQDVGLDNSFVNLDCANLILYGKGNPVDALDVIGKYVRGLHAKDGLFPTNPRNLGKEVPIGEGKANFPVLIKRLRALHYHGPVTIEREISGPEQLADIRKEKVYLEKLIG